ncbi:uncharacterized protein [Argopecten irradians]|uniref:uncharacterized protein n=1 Tax=Argopecten irradians TaxID=31199 RepID=UPI00372183D7
MDLVNVTVDDLADSLRQFYAEARPKKTEMSADENQMYHKNTLINIRGAINRHLTDIHRDIDIIRDKQFKKANGVLDGLLKLRARSGTLKPTNHKEIIDKMHMERISTYLSNCSTNPIILRQNVWFNLSIHFVTRGMEFHHQLSTNSFTFHKNEPLDSEYVTINHSTQQKNYQGGIHSDEAPQDKRMYSTGTASCPVKMLKLLISKSDTVDGPCALFTQYKRNAVESPSTHEFWYTRKPLSKRTFSNFLADICKSAGVDKKYTPHCLRATAIQFLNDQGHETRHIMFMSSHKNESSLRSYTRNLSTCQKKAMSSALSTLSLPSEETTADHVGPVAEAPVGQIVTHDQARVPAINGNISHGSQITFAQNTSMTSAPGFFANATFHGCTINFTK